MMVVTLLAFASMGFAQLAPIDFETEGNGATWTWTPFENDSNLPVGIIANPDASGINTSATVASYTALVTGQPWAGFESQHGADIGSFSFDVTNSIVKVMVYKSVISDVGVKFAEANGDAQPEIKVANTVINEWEELTFDLSGSIGAGATGVIDQIIFFPDFDLAGRSTDNTVYIDNVSFSGEALPPGPAAQAPIPVYPATEVNAIFSDSYTNISGTNFYPGWGQETIVSEVSIEGNNTLLYTGLNYQGIELGSPQDVSGLESLHLDFWSSNSTALEVFLISQSTGEQTVVLPMTHDGWVSVDVPLSAYSDQGLALSDIFQLKFVGNGDVYLDNLLFLGEGAMVEEGPYGPIDFETDGYGADWTWTVFENGANDPIVIGANPSTTGINSSAIVASITALTTGAPWVGFESLHGAGIGSFSLDATNSTVKIMVLKSVISDVGIKFAEANGEAQPEIKVPNTLIDEWEELTFDFSGQIGLGATGILDQIIIFPDFNLDGRTTDNLCYVDNITFSAQELPDGPAAQAPLPTADAEDVSSIFSDTYTNIDDTNFNPNWGQTTAVSEVLIEGNNTLLYSGLNYQGTNLGGPEGLDQDISGFEFLHVDFWTPNTSVLNFFLISRTTGEQAYTLPAVSGEWVSVEIPLTHFTDLGLGLTDIFQFKVDGGDGSTTVYWDNWYFYSESVAPPIDLIGTWIMAPEAGALKVGPGPNDGSWWSNSATDVETRACFFDDEYVFGEDGSYANIFDGDTWLETWQGVAADGCGAPVAPHDGMTPSTWTLDPEAGTVTLNGVGAYLGIPKAFTGGELTNPADAPASITYEVTLTDSNQTMTLVISTGGGYWTFKLIDINSIIQPEPVPLVAAPTPTVDANQVLSIFSDAYTDLAETNFNPNWGQSTQVSFEEIESNSTMKYAGLNYQGTNLGGPEGVDQDLSGYEFIHVDFWTANASALNFFLISRASGEQAYALPITAEEWVGVDIPLSHFTDLGLSLTDIFQIKIDGGDGSTNVYFDNWYFFTTTVGVDDLVMLPLKSSLEQNFPNPFNPSTTIRYSLAVSEHVTLKLFNINGQELAMLVDGVASAGEHSYYLNAGDLAAGTYLYSLTTGSKTRVKKMVLIK